MGDLVTAHAFIQTAMRFDLTDLRLLLHIVETGSITAGADRSAMALASASARVRGMEETLGVPLLERGRRGISPTPAGRAAVHHARLVLHQIERMRGELAEYAKGLKGHVRLLSNTAALTEFLPDALAGFLAANPSIDIDLEERPSHAIVEAVAAGLADLGVVADMVDLAGLETRPFRADHLVAVMAPGHPLAGHEAIAFADLLDEPFVGLSPGSALQDYLNAHAARAGRTLAFRVRVRSADALCRLVERGVGLGIVPETAAQRASRGAAIRIVPLRDAWAPRLLVLCARRFTDLPAHARRLVDTLSADAPAASTRNDKSA
ncbi:LysR family transcriptional regulator [Azospirillum picis]|uniref:DNA-binding transcriptional LysR family regulator n=1 Tax=Azospirillum picis TaxID=488438 RepID=A0ABU0MT88_9PROT|nr:LysR family transcriptional regulator [Azospirillum picis]MBP2302925.1 DNA-binding transcriptional LysR family regulator [Azospirillum picis]MDQ0536677.1 DNA-binding transcriptional LysR family regulator [Azospirillum picis]